MRLASVTDRRLDIPIANAALNYSEWLKIREGLGEM